MLFYAQCSNPFPPVAILRISAISPFGVISSALSIIFAIHHPSCRVINQLVACDGDLWKAKIIFTNYHPMFTNCQAAIYQSINFLRGSIKIKSGDLSGILTGSAFIFLVASICTLFKVSDVDRASKRSVLFFKKVPNTKNTNIQKITFSFFMKK